MVDPTGLYSEICTRKPNDSRLETPKNFFKHCYLRVGGKSGDTVSFFADGPLDPEPSVSTDGSADAPAECRPVSGSSPPQCEPEQLTDFDMCLMSEVAACAECTYLVVGFNCCQCIQRAVSRCEGRVDSAPAGYPNGVNWR